MKWPIDCDSPTALDRALGIAMEYLERAGQAENYPYVEELIALILVRSWRAGVRHPIRLANDVIVALEGRSSRVDITQLYPRVS
jgi:hypothetical protein